ncbi:Lipase class 3 [Lasiodiplodia theobromae]|uniref:Putative feruloyl esterase A n=1 Tax=Lasiodiplodia theobromae TaxID=45133 RepID=A0A5N5DS08_9PEZI|nr:Lipase class 3 [Lasiodiplodia theobromae]KAB2580779.1 putative feruloyl esterase A [Lasiodiplodia theobromae]KAF4542388.1 Lipase class 3 [Lasiodiplodia theobromae]KAF9635850.1 Lipase class 3 [Lasiodiplodia theobromae]
MLFRSLRVFILAVCSCLSVGSPIAKRKTPGPSVSNELFAKFVRYADFSSAAYASDCPNPPFGATVTHRINNPDTDTQGFVARDDTAKEIVIAFRGTSNLADFGTDFSQKLIPYTSPGVTAACDDCTAHEGFLTAWNSVANESILAVRDQLSSNPSYAVTVTGHSLGASLAALATLSFIGSDIPVTTYTFGQPRTGNAAWADFVDQQAPSSKLFRVTHANDGVPQTIPTSDGYKHHSTEYWQRDAATPLGVFQCSGQEPSDCNNSVRGTGLGAHGIGINAAHLKYLSVSTGNPLDGGATACKGKPPGILGGLEGFLGLED